MIIQTQNLSHTYSKDTPFERTALKGINFHASKEKIRAVRFQVGRVFSPHQTKKEEQST